MSQHNHGDGYYPTLNDTPVTKLKADKDRMHWGPFMGVLVAAATGAALYRLSKYISTEYFEGSQSAFWVLMPLFVIWLYFSRDENDIKERSYYVIFGKPVIIIVLSVGYIFLPKLPNFMMRIEKYPHDPQHIRNVEANVVVNGFDHSNEVIVPTTTDTKAIELRRDALAQGLEVCQYIEQSTDERRPIADYKNPRETPAKSFVYAKQYAVEFCITVSMVYGITIAHQYMLLEKSIFELTREMVQEALRALAAREDIDPMTLWTMKPKDIQDYLCRHISQLSSSEGLAVEKWGITYTHDDVHVGNFSFKDPKIQESVEAYYREMGEKAYKILEADVYGSVLEKIQKLKISDGKAVEIAMDIVKEDITQRVSINGKGSSLIALPAAS